MHICTHFELIARLVSCLAPTVCSRATRLSLSEYVVSLHGAHRVNSKADMQLRELGRAHRKRRCDVKDMIWVAGDGTGWDGVGRRRGGGWGVEWVERGGCRDNVCMGFRIYGMHVLIVLCYPSTCWDTRKCLTVIPIDPIERTAVWPGVSLRRRG